MTATLLRHIAAISRRSMSYSYAWVATAFCRGGYCRGCEADRVEPDSTPTHSEKEPPLPDENEPLKKAAERELQEETSIDPHNVHLFEVGSYGDPGRDPRGWAVSILYATVVNASDVTVEAADDAAAAQWYDIARLPPLAFDHKLLVRDTLQKILHSADEFGVLETDLHTALNSDALKEPWISTSS